MTPHDLHREIPVGARGKSGTLGALTDSWTQRPHLILPMDGRSRRTPPLAISSTIPATPGGFARFWNYAAGYCYDVIDGLQGHDPALRPNQILAVSLPRSPLDLARQRTVVDVCARQLPTSHGLRSLAPDDPAIIGYYGGDQRQRDGAYHQGMVWDWLIGPFVTAYLRVCRDPAAERAFLAPFACHLADHGLGSVSEIFDGESPLHPARLYRPGLEHRRTTAGVAGNRWTGAALKTLGVLGAAAQRGANA